jgi:pilus assembly protein CpaE
MTALAVRNRPADAAVPQVLALVTDSATEATVRLAAAELGLGDIAVEGADLESAAQRLHTRASPSVLIVDLDGTRGGDPLAGLNHLAEACDPGVKVIAVGMHNDVALYRTLVQAGVADYLVKPVTAHDLVRAIRDGVSFGKAPVVELAAHSDGAPMAKRLVVVVGTRGGTGASTVAANLAVTLSQREPKPSALLDLDFRFGSAAVAFDIEPGSGFKDVLADPTRIDPLLIERAATKIADRLILLAAEEPFSAGPPLTAGLVPLLETLSRGGGWVVADMPRDLLIREADCLNAAAVVVLVTDFSLASLRDVLRFKEWIAETAPATKLLLVANGSRPKLEGDLPPAEFSRAASVAVAGTIPFDPKGIGAATRDSKPVVIVAPRSPAARAIGALAEQILGASKTKPQGGGFTLASLLPFLAKDRTGGKG